MTSPRRDKAHRRPAILPFAMQQIRIIAPFARGYGWAIPVMAAAGFLASLLESLAIGGVILLLYATVGPGAEAADPGGALSRLFAAAGALSGDGGVRLVALIIGLVAAKSALGLGYNMLTARIKHVISERARNRVHSQYLHLPYAHMHDRDHGTLINTLANESWAVSDAFYSFARMGTNITAFAVFGGILLVIAWEIALIAAIGSVALSLGLRTLAARVRRLGREARDANAELAGRMANTLRALRTIRAYSQEDLRQRAFERNSRQARDSLTRMDHAQSFLAPISEVGYLLLLALIAWVATLLAIPFVSILGAVALLYRLRPHIREFDGNRLALAGLAASLESVQAVVDAPGEDRPATGTRTFPGLRSEVRFDRVTFRYPAAATDSLRDVGFTIRRGAVTAIVGPSGSGKTTIVNLLLRLYAPTAGAVLVDGLPLEELDRPSWLQRLAVAGQDAELIDDTVIENIRLARPDAGMDEIEEAARLAGIHDFIDALPGRFDSRIGQHGVNLSGGQRQRIGLARALIRRPDLLILDEATNAVERSLERRIQANVARVMAGRTTVIVSNRLDDLPGVDHVVWLEYGEIRCQGAAARVLAAG